MAEYTPGLKPYEAKFFKIWELGYDSAQGRDVEESSLYIISLTSYRKMGQCYSFR
jgi:hypothetical protein